MALSAKVAALICLGFTFGMSWLVSLVARPMVELPTPLIVRGLDVPDGKGLAAGEPAQLKATVSPVELASRFAEPSPLERAGERGPQDGRVLRVAAASPADIGAGESALPPLHVPEAPVVRLAGVAVGGETGKLAHRATSEHLTAIPEAIVSRVPPRPAGTPVALRSESRPDPGGSPEGESGDAGAAGRVATKYRVRRGDTLVNIMRRQWKTDSPQALNVLLAANPQVAKRRDCIYAGEMLNIPVLERSPAVPLEAVTVAGAPSATWKHERRPKVIRYYTIRKRDSLASIARRFLRDEERWREIAELNQMRNANVILPGTRIKLPETANRDT